MESITGGNTPKYQELTEQLRLQIVSGEIAPGQKLPSENTLSAQYQVSRQTVRKALAILQNEGYIYAEHGRGTFCSEMMRHAHPSKNIAVVTTYLSDYIFPRVIQGIDDVVGPFVPMAVGSPGLWNWRQGLSHLSVLQPEPSDAYLALEI